MTKKILISSCLLGINCRYDGGNCERSDLKSQPGGSSLLMVCPEELGGLTTPRPPAEIQTDGRVRNKLGDDVTTFYQEGAQKVLLMVLQEDIKKAYLKSNSPMCGKAKIYDGTFSGKLIDGNGILVDLLEKNGIKVHSVD